MRALLCAIAFLTRFPVPRRFVFDASDVGRAALWFPLVGALLGCLAVAVRHLLAPHLPPSIVAVVIIATFALATGALHLDGLADMADGFGGGHTRTDILRIMRDHVIGAYGACALVITVGLTATALASLVDHGSDGVFIVIPAIARWPGVIVSRVVPYARAEGGLGSALTNHVSIVEIVGATATALALALVLCGAFGAVLIAIAAIVSVLQARWCLRKIGGITGDTLGSNVVICEALLYVVAVAAR